MRLLRRPLSCQEVVGLATDYLEGALSPALSAAVDKHLAGCESCPRYFAQLRLTMRLSAALRDERDDVPDEVVDALTRAWDEVHGNDPPRD